ncbi:hypothetical protein [Streptomyces minutiscleroticus]|uniref:hypothetical protein n=1 Tax=Streptomyces minutiscleroticus TaxID=68238 RepID=UPI0033330B6F
MSEVGLIRGPRHGDVSLFRARLAAFPGATAASAVLVLVTAFLAAALPGAVEGYENGALRETLREASVAGRSVTLSAPVSDVATPFGTEALLTPRALASTEAAFRRVVRPPLALDRDATVYGVRSADELPLTDPGLPRPSGLDPTATLVAQRDLAARARLVEGRMPRARGDAGGVEAVLTESTAARLGVTAGAVLHVPRTLGSGFTIRVTGVVAPRSPAAAYWNAERDVRAPELNSVARDGRIDRFWHVTALVDPRAANALLRLRNGAVAYWYHPADAEALTARDVSALRDRLAALRAGPDVVRLREGGRHHGLTVEENGLATLLEPFERERRAARPLVTIAAVSVGTVAGTVLLVSAGLQATRRRSELALLRARGAGLPGLAAGLCAESAVAALPAAAAGLALALLVMPPDTWLPAVAAAAAVAATASLALPLRAVAAVRAPRPERRDDLTAARPSRRRTVAELTAAVVVTGAVVAVRRRGTGGDPDLFTAAAPVLIAVVAALVLLRVYPLPVRLLARLTRRLDGPVLHLGAARAGRAPSTAVLPLLAVVVALTMTSFGGSVLAGVAEGRDRAAVAKVGADARVESMSELPKGLAERVSAVAGVRDVVGVHTETVVEPNESAARTQYEVAAVDPERYARLVRDAGTGGALPAGALAGHGREPLPAVASPRLARQFGKGPVTIPTSFGQVRIRVVATRDTTPAAHAGEFVVLSAEALARARADLPPAAFEPTTLLVTGRDLDGDALRRAVRPAGSGIAVSVRAEERAAFATTPLQTGASRVYLAAVAASTGYSLLALLLATVHNAAQRRAFLARLRIMGMPGPQRQWLAVLETLPQVLLGAVGGVLVSPATVLLLRPGVDLTALAFTTAKAADAQGAVLRVEPASLLLPAAGLVVLACAALTAQAWAAGRRSEGTQLRIGDQQ